MKIQIKHYFTKDFKNNLTPSELNRINNLRNDLNALPTLREQQEYIELWRLSQNNRALDRKAFGINYSDKIKLTDDRSILNEHYKNTHFVDLDAMRLKYAQYDNEIKNNKKEKKKLAKQAQDAIQNGEDQEARDLNEKIDNLDSGTPVNIAEKITMKMAYIVSNMQHLGTGLLLLSVLTAATVGILAFIGFLSSFGSTPFEVCGGSASISGAVKVKDGYKMPVEYMHAGGNGYNGTGWNGPDEERGIGWFASEDFVDFAGPGTGDQYSRTEYAAAGRWEYVNYHVRKNMWPGHENYGSKTADGVDTDRSPVFYNIDMEQYNWTLKQKVLVVNPENGKAVVVHIGNAKDDNNWGGSPLSAGPLGLSYLAQQALGFTGVPELPGGDYDVNSRDSGVALEAWWLMDEDTPEGPVHGSFSTNKKNKCKRANTSIGNENLAEALVSYAHPSVEYGIPNTTENNGNGTDLYVAVHDAVYSGDPWYQTCDRSVASAIRWSGTDDQFPPGGCIAQLEYLRSSRGQEYWEDITGKVFQESDLQPGDIMIDEGHIFAYVGLDAIKKKFPDAPDDMRIVHGSIGDANGGSPDQQPYVTNNWGPSVDKFYFKTKGMGGRFYVYRSIKHEDQPKYKDIDVSKFMK